MHSSDEEQCIIKKASNFIPLEGGRVTYSLQTWHIDVQIGMFSPRKNQVHLVLGNSGSEVLQMALELHHIWLL